MKRWICAALVALLLSAAFGLAEGAIQEKSLTLMIYITGSDLESEYGAATADIQEMLDSGFDDSRVNLLVMAGGSQRWYLGYDPGETVISQLGARGMRVVDRQSARNMGDAATLSGFLDFCVDRYPAEQYALILWDHGGGPMEGVCYDELNGMDSLSLRELSLALSQSPFADGQGLDWIGFDACMMASVETAHVCAPYARYMIASQETEPATGWNYAFLSGLDGNQDGAEVGRRVIEAYVDPDERAQLLTMSCTDLGRVEAVETAMGTLFTALRGQLNAETFSRLSQARLRTKSFGRATTDSDYDLADLYDLSANCAALAPGEAEALQAALDDAVVYSNGNQADAHGLSVYSPYYNKNFFSAKWREEYRALGLASGYTSYMGSYAGLWLGAPLADWSQLSYGALAYADGVQPVSLALTEAQLTHFASARVIILRESGDGDSYYDIFAIDDVPLDASAAEGATLTADYDYSALYVVDADGEPLTDSYPFFTIDGYYYVRVILESESLTGPASRYDDAARDPDYRAEKALLRCTLDAASGELEVLEVIRDIESPDELGTGRQGLSLDVERWPWLMFDAASEPLQISRDQDGAMLPATEWPRVGSVDYRRMDLVDTDGNVTPVEEWARGQSTASLADGSHFFGEVDNSKPWRLKFLPRQYGAMGLYAQFIVTDTQGQQTASELIPLHNPAVADEKAMDVEIYDRGGVEIRLKKLSVVGEGSDRGVLLWFEAQNDTSAEYSFSLYRPIVNRTGLQNYLHSPQRVAPNGTSAFFIRLAADELPPLEDGVLHSISFLPELVVFELGGGETWDPRATVDAELDLAALDPPRVSPYDDAEVLGAAEDEGVHFDLMSLVEADDGALHGVVRLENLTNEDRCVYIHVSGYARPPVAVNDGYIANALVTAHSLALPPEGNALLSFEIPRESISRRYAWHRQSRFADADMFDHWDIRTVESVTLIYGLGKDNLNNGGDIATRRAAIALTRPLALGFQGGETPAAAPLLNADEPTAVLRSVGWNDGRLLLYVDLGCASDRFGGLSVGECTVDGAAATGVIRLESDESSAQALARMSWRGRERAIIELSAESGALPSRFDELRLSFSISPQGANERQTGTVVIAPRAPIDLADGDADAGRFDVTPASIIESFDPQIVVPENAIDSRVRLSAPLDPDIAREIVQGWVFLATPRQDDPDLYDMIAFQYDPLSLDGGEVSVDFCGLVPVIRGASAPIPSQFITHGSQVGLTTLRGIDVNGLRTGDGGLNITIETLSFSLSPSKGSAYITEYRGSGKAVDDTDTLSVVQYSVPARVARLPDGAWALPVVEDLQLGVREAVDFDDRSPVIEFRPAAEFDPVVVFFLQRADNSGFSLVVPYPAG